ncbi:DUF6153 family protein [Arthrobacter sp. Helios]|uniref:DUF6153 family protein n=1 Tax=Arthrobacter sp. Helios TaxID=2828862 RepID=UPI00206C75B8|nr:DUF6153 family protein [Arthrobacter sp. Helios]UPO78032.1 DUF6153 family protein [Arthrobacter sp. Helios]
MRAGIRAAAGHALTLRSTPQLFSTALGLLAILAGILGMHMLADPQAAASHSGASHSVSGQPGTTAHSAGTALRHDADPAPAAAPASDGGGHASGACPDCGPAGCAAGLCMMFLVLVSITAVLGLLTSRRYRNPDRPDPPRAFPVFQAPPAAPSLVQLCISRT